MLKIWARQDSNLRPSGYEPRALPLSYGPEMGSKNYNMLELSSSPRSMSGGRLGEGSIRYLQ